MSAIKKIIFTVLILLSLCSAFAQNKTVDSLKIILKNSKHDTTRCKILELMTDAEYDDNIWPQYNDTRLKIAEKNILSETNPQTKKVFIIHAACAYENMGVLAHQQGNIQKALAYFEKGLKLSEQINFLAGIADGYNNVGVVYEKQGDIFKALEYFQKSLKIREGINNKYGIAQSLSMIGAIYDNQGDISKALEYHLKSLKIREEIKDKQGIGESLINIASIYGNQGDETKALEYDNKSLKILEEIEDKRSLSAVYNNMADIYKNRGGLNKAFEYLEKSLKFSQETHNKIGEAYGLSNLGNIYIALNNYDKAMEYHQKSLNMRIEIQDKQGEAHSLGSIAEMLRYKGKYDEALVYANKSLAKAKELGFPHAIIFSATVLKNIYKKQNKFKEALEIYELEMKMKDSINNQETQKETVKKQMQYNYAKQELLQKAEQDKKDAIANEEKQKQNIIIYSIGTGLFLVLLLSIFIFRGYRQKQKANTIITQQKFEVENQKNLIEEKHKEITDSINYAERIQRALLASKKTLDENLNDYFILFKPKDVVSGDFYWATAVKSLDFGDGSRDAHSQSRTNNPKPVSSNAVENFVLVTADSTGHGVPGAIMSILNIACLDKAITKGITSADLILNETRTLIIENLKNDGSTDGGKDGMDGCLLSFDFKNNILNCACANNPVWIVRKPVDGALEATLIEIKPDRMPIGKHEKDKSLFTLHTFNFKKGDVIYTLTDGFSDQFGGTSGKKFKNKQLQQLLLSIAQEPMEVQKQKLANTFDIWKGELEQIDDVCIIGVRV